MTRLALLGALTVVGLTSCATAVKPPPISDYELSSSRVAFRAYSSAAGICAAEPRWLFDEVANVNNLIEKFNESVAPDKSGLLTDRQLMMLDEANKTLPAVLDAQERNVDLMSECSFSTSRGFPILRKRAKAYVATARQTLEAAPRLIAQERSRRELEEWRAYVRDTRTTARLGCPPGNIRRPKPVVYFAFEDELGRTTWLFCDGSRVTSEKGGEPVFEISSTFTAGERRRVKAPVWVQAAKRFPTDVISRPPSGPSEPRSTATANSTKMDAW